MVILGDTISDLDLVFRFLLLFASDPQTGIIDFTAVGKLLLPSCNVTVEK